MYSSGFLVALLLCICFSAQASLLDECQDASCQALVDVVDEFEQRDPIQATSQLEQLIAKLDSTSPSYVLASAYFYQGRFARLQSAYDEAATAYQQSLTLFGQLQQPAAVAHVFSELARLHQARYEFTEALGLAYKAFNSFYQVHQRSAQAEQKVVVGSILLNQGRIDAALSLLQHVLQDEPVAETPQISGRALFYIGTAYLQMKQYNLASQYLNDAHYTLQTVPDRFFLGRTLVAKGHLRLHQERHDEARRWFGEALALFSQINAASELHLTHGLLGLLEVEAGQAEKGFAALATAMDFAKERNLMPLELALHRLYALGLQATAQPDEALAHLTAGIEQAETVGLVSVQADLLAQKADLLFSLGRYQQAYHAQEQGQALAVSMIDEGRLQLLMQQSAQLQLERQAQSITLLKKDQAMQLAQAEQRNLRNMLILGLVISLMMFLFLLYGRLSHQRQNRLLKSQVKLRTQELEQKNLQLENAYKILEEASLRDPLTGLYNRYYLKSRLPGEIKRAQHAYSTAEANSHPSQADLLCFLIDIDHFKGINDEYGHLNGDRFLVQFADIINEVFRDTDLRIRWGGEEFLVICRQSCRTTLTTLVERFRQAVRQHRFVLIDDSTIQATCSIGFCALPVSTHAPLWLKWEQAFAMVDDCLYAAKLSGRDCWVGVINAAPQEDDSRSVAPLLAKKYTLSGIQVATSLNNSAAIMWPTAQPGS